MRSNQFAYSCYHLRTPQHDQLVKLSLPGAIVFKQHVTIEGAKHVHANGDD
jgi:hypothetical protein